MFRFWDFESQVLESLHDAYRGAPAPWLPGLTLEVQPMIVCSCAVISDRDLEAAVLEIMSLPNAPLPTPGIVYRHLAKRMNCCGCAPLAIETIYAKMEELEARGLVCPCACASARGKLREIIEKPARPVTRPRRTLGPDLAREAAIPPTLARRRVKA